MAAKNSKLVKRIYVSTDCKTIVEGKSIKIMSLCKRRSKKTGSLSHAHI